MIEAKAYAKLNLSLDVTERRDDGYHNMIMIMQSVSLCDVLYITPNKSGRLRAASNLCYIPSDERNLAVKTAETYLKTTGRTGQGLDIKIKKNIPVGAGLAGGSADAAAVLRGLNELYRDGMSRRELETLAEEIGSDVAFCVSGGTALATGRGEKLSPLPSIPRCWFVICKPQFSISTPELFKKLDNQKLRSHPDTAGAVEAIKDGDLPQLCRRLYNVFEDVDDRRMKTVAEIKSRLLDRGAMGAVMTGTGSAVFGVFSQKETAGEACAALKREQSFCCVAQPQACFF